MSNREVMQQALEALEDERYVSARIVDAITALRTALEQPEQKPMHPELRKMWEDYFDKCFRTRPEQEPVAKLFGTLPVYDTPPAAQRPWQGLTDEDWDKIGDMPDSFDQGVAWAEAKLKERNT
jgi:hypothetical protein